MSHRPGGSMPFLAVVCTTITIGWLFRSAGVVVAAVPAAEHETTTPTMITIPLIPHHVVRQRKLQEQGGGQAKMIPKMERPKYSKYDRRFLARSAEEATAQQVAGLYQGYGTHYVDLWCGSPNPQRQTVIVDTGSGVTAFPCNECEKCGVPDYHIDLLFDGTASQSYRKLSCDECLKGDCRKNECTMGMSYAEGSSWHAYEVIDNCYIGGLHDTAMRNDDGNPDDMDPYHAKAFSFDLKFGCQTSITGLFIQQLADGIMGMDVAPAAFWWQMHAAGKISRKAFSMCFSRSDHPTKEGVVAGAMSLGGTDTRLHDTPMIYSKVTSKSMGFYVVTIRKVYLRQGGGGQSAVSTNPRLKVVRLDISESSLNSQRVIVDSGTTDTYFTTRIAGVFGLAYQNMMGKPYDHKAKKFTPEELALEPTIILQLAGDETHNPDGTYGLASTIDPENPYDILVAIPPEHYYEYDEDEGGYVARFYTDEGSGTVLGANAMLGHEVYFDVEGDRIGWAESSCDYAAAVAKFTNRTDVTTTPLVPATMPQESSPVGEPVYIPELLPPGEEPATNDSPETAAVTDSTDPEMEVDDYEAELDDDEGIIDPTMDNPASPLVDNKFPYNDQSTSGNTNEEQSGEYIYDPQKFCAGLGCQVGILLSMIAFIVIAAFRITRRASQSYDSLGNNNGNELELKVEEFVNYRDKEFA